MPITYSLFSGLSQEQKRAIVKSVASQLLAESAWTLLPDARVDTVAWLAYRKQVQALSDGTTNLSDVVEFPDPPSLVLTPDVEARLLRRDTSFDEAFLATQLRTLTPAQAVNYIDTTVVDLQSAKVVLKVMARLLIAMRNRLWPNLPEG